MDPGIARFDLMLELIDADERLSGWLEYSTDLFDAATMARMAAHLQTLLEAIVANPEEPYLSAAFLPAGERRQVLVDWNDTADHFGRLGTFSERFARQVERAPDAVAVSAGRVQLSYRELARRSSAIADRLAVRRRPRRRGHLACRARRRFPGGDDRGAAGRRSVSPLDPMLPAARLAPDYPVTAARRSCWPDKSMRRRSKRRCPGSRPEDARSPEPRGYGRGAAAATRPAGPAGASSLAYVIYTSGSTGVPKGAMIEQRGLINHLLSKISDLELSASDVVAQTSPQSFVISVWQFLAALMVGARVHICADEKVQDPALAGAGDQSARG